jgi:DNA polymerase-3 subunit epsilon
MEIAVKLKRPLVTLDLETTGTWIEKDRIIEIAMIRCLPDGTRQTYEQRIYPGIAIPADVTEVTGISDEDVRNCPRFREVAPGILAFLNGADIGGFNVERFDLPLLAREFSDCGMKFEWEKRVIYDAQKIYHLHERRDLAAAYAFYCNKELLDAHSALADSQATLEVLTAQIKKYGGGQEDVEALREFDYRKRTEFHDSKGKLRWWNGELYMMFGKYSRKEPLREIARNDRPYLQWILTQDFSDEVKDVVEQALEGHFPQCPQLK